MSLTVVVDAWHLGNFSANRGIGTYLRNILRALADENEIRVVALALPQTVLPEGVERRRAHRLAPNRFAQKEHDLRLPADLVRAVRKNGGDVVLSPADDPPRRSPRPWVQTVHDLIPLAVRDPAFEPAAARWKRIGPRLHSAEAVVTDSRSTAADAVRLLGLPPERVRVAPLGVDAGFTPPATRSRTEPPWLLYVGEYGPHKGFAEAFAVVGELAEAGLPHRLAMVGYLAPWHQAAVSALLAAAPRSDRIDVLGYIDDVVGAYQRADALILTSRYEGFGLPALEAMACGTPVVAFANSAITELVSGGGVLVPDGDTHAMAKALRALLTNNAMWQETSARGIEHAVAYSWGRCANIHAEVLRAAAGVDH